MSKEIDFIESIKDAAIAACKNKNLFPSVIIAQACLESNFGISRLSLNCNNFFGIKSNSHWTGPVRSFPTSEYVKNQKIITKASFCQFHDFEECLLFHNDMLHRVPVYAAHGLFKCATPEAQANVLRLAGYATDPNYTKSLINLIKEYNLKQYDIK